MGRIKIALGTLSLTALLAGCASTTPATCEPEIGASVKSLYTCACAKSGGRSTVEKVQDQKSRMGRQRVWVCSDGHGSTSRIMSADDTIYSVKEM